MRFPYAKIYPIKGICKPGYEGKWCCAWFFSTTGHRSVSFNYFNSRDEAIDHAERGKPKTIEVDT